jgi:lipoprotein-anchoring transpeptidase ErfK/SrfK
VRHTLSPVARSSLLCAILIVVLVVTLAACSQATSTSTGVSSSPSTATSQQTKQSTPASSTAVTATSTSTSAPPSGSDSTSTTAVSGDIQPQYQFVQAISDVHAYASPGGAKLHTFTQINILGQLTTMPVTGPSTEQGGRVWYPVLLPMRPNGSTGWVSSDEVVAAWQSAAIVVQLADRRLTVYQRGVELASYPIGIGTDTNFTPTGNFFVTGILKRRNPNGAYGPYALGTSAFSEKLTDWPGGGVVGIHGTNDPSSVGRNVTHGCIRLYNKDITELVTKITLGTPIFIRP